MSCAKLAKFRPQSGPPAHEAANTPPMNDVDIEMHDLETAAHTMGRLRKKGICFHGWTVKFGEPATVCRDCGKVFPSFEAMNDERDELKAEYL